MSTNTRDGASIDATADMLLRNAALAGSKAIGSSPARCGPRPKRRGQTYCPSDGCSGARPIR